MDFSNYHILETHRLFVNTRILKLKCIFTGDICYAQQGHLKHNGEISEERYNEIKAKLNSH